MNRLAVWLISPKDRSNRTVEFRGFHNEKVIVCLLMITWPANSSMFSSSGEGPNCDIAFDVALLNLQKTLTDINPGTANAEPGSRSDTPEGTK